MEQVARDIPSRRPGDAMIAEELLEQGCGLTLGRYTLLRKIAAGGMAEVYVARSQGVSGFAKRVALKKILPQFSHNRKFLEMLLDEAKISVSLAHPNIAQVYELGIGAQDTHFIVMEYVEGRPLNRVLQRALERGQPGLPITHAVNVMSEVAKGLDHAHKQVDSNGESLQIVHRDVSPQNVLLSYQGNVKLIDFGIARAQGRAGQTGHGIIKGKLRYLAPEIASGREPDHRADIFCCGLVLFELLTGEPMYAPNSDMHALELARRAEVRSARESNRAVPEDLERILMRMLARDRDDRYASAKDLYAELRLFLNRFDPMFNESELSDYMQSMFKTEIAEARTLDALAEKIAANEGRLAEEPTVAVDKWELLIEEVSRQEGRPASPPSPGSPGSPGSAHSPKLRVVGADGGEAMSVVVEDESSEVSPRINDGPGPRTMPRAAMPTLKEPAHPRPRERLEEPLEDSVIGPLIDEPPPPKVQVRSSTIRAITEAQEQAAQIPPQPATATIHFESSKRVSLLAPLMTPPLPVPVTEHAVRPARAVVWLAAATIAVSITCLVISMMVTPAAPKPIEIEVVRQPLVEPSEPPVEIKTLPPVEREPLRLKSYQDEPQQAAEDRELEDSAPAIALEVEPGDEEPDRVRPRSPRPGGGTLLVNSRPVSTISVDGKKMGRTPQVLLIKPGPHQITLEGPTGEQKTFSRKITAGKNPPLTWRWR